jgi:hydroxymethylglutaryl-CoA lyase
MSKGEFVRVVEVGPRDGLQNEPQIVPTAVKVQFIEMLADAGLCEIEVSSFVSPKRVPQLADAADVFAALKPRPSVRYSALVPNAKGLERALESHVKAIAVFTAASETFTQRNIGMTIAESLETFRALIPQARASGLWIRAYVSTAFHCPYEGRILPAQVVPVVRELLAMGVDEISLGDTIGHAVPAEVAELTTALRDVLPLPQWAYHFHDTRRTALDNVRQSLMDDIRIFDSSAGGLGGCPFAPGASGNLATEELLALLSSLGYATGVDAEQVAAATRFLHSTIFA